jgi:hypothetical protein
MPQNPMVMKKKKEKKKKPLEFTKASWAHQKKIMYSTNTFEHALII